MQDSILYSFHIFPSSGTLLIAFLSLIKSSQTLYFLECLAPILTEKYNVRYAQIFPPLTIGAMIEAAMPPMWKRGIALIVAIAQPLLTIAFYMLNGTTLGLLVVPLVRSTSGISQPPQCFRGASRALVPS